MLGDLESALLLAGYEVALVYDQDNRAIEIANKTSFLKRLVYLDGYPEAGRGDYRDLLFKIITVVRETEN